MYNSMNKFCYILFIIIFTLYLLFFISNISLGRKLNYQLGNMHDLQVEVLLLRLAIHQL